MAVYKRHGYLPYAFPCNMVLCVCVDPKATSLSAAPPLCLSLGMVATFKLKAPPLRTQF